jgi:diaminopimelate epimerase
MIFHKYHALGNDYIVINPADIHHKLTADQIQRICHRNFGIGSDGILLGPFEKKAADFAVKIFNPDGSEAEKSGNGLRIFSRYLWDKGLVQDQWFTIHTAGGIVKSRVYAQGRSATIEMGKVSFRSDQIPVGGEPREVINEPLRVDGHDLIFCAATIGNPHCIIPCRDISAEETRRLGPGIENHPLFPNKINVQFMKVLDRANIQIEIWERGAGYTLASGSSSSAAAAVAHRLGHCDSDIVVHMPGGNIDISISDDFQIMMTGSVTKVIEGTLSAEIFDAD